LERTKKKGSMSDQHGKIPPPKKKKTGSLYKVTRKKENWLATSKGNSLPLYTLKHIQKLNGSTTTIYF
jgi:hypothetical protein